MTTTKRKVAILVLAALMSAGAVFAGSSVSNTTVPNAHAAKAGGVV